MDANFPLVKWIQVLFYNWKQREKKKYFLSVESVYCKTFLAIQICVAIGFFLVCAVFISSKFILNTFVAHTVLWRKHKFKWIIWRLIDFQSFHSYPDFKENTKKKLNTLPSVLARNVSAVFTSLNSAKSHQKCRKWLSSIPIQ